MRLPPGRSCLIAIGPFLPTPGPLEVRNRSRRKCKSRKHLFLLVPVAGVEPAAY